MVRRAFTAGISALCVGAVIACASSDFEPGHPDAPTFDVVIIPGCPTNADGTLSQCLLRRVVWGAYLWEQGVTSHFITSGAATYNRYIEAEAIAAGLVFLGVPADNIWLDIHARHTDENMYNALQIAERLGFESKAVASELGHAAAGCSFLGSWGSPCLFSGVDGDLVEQRLATSPASSLEEIQLTPVRPDTWLRVDAYEDERAANGGPDRPPSWLLYTYAPILRAFGDPWVPHPPPDEPLRRYSTQLHGAIPNDAKIGAQ